MVENPQRECECRTTKGPVTVVGTEVICDKCRMPRYMKLNDPLANAAHVQEAHRQANAKLDLYAGISTPIMEAVDHPAHYGGADDPYEAIKVIEAWGLGFHLGNAVKYICRCRRKGEMIEQLKKARWYLDREISRLEKE